MIPLKSFRTLTAGILLGILVSVIFSLLIDVDPTGSQLVARTELSLSDILLASAAGIAASLAHTTGLPAALIGLMVAVALLFQRVRPATWWEGRKARKATVWAIIFWAVLLSLPECERFFSEYDQALLVD